MRDALLNCLRPGRGSRMLSQPAACAAVGEEGDRYLRTMLVQGAQYILGAFWTGP